MHYSLDAPTAYSREIRASSHTQYKPPVIR